MTVRAQSNTVGFLGFLDQPTKHDHPGFSGFSGFFQPLLARKGPGFLGF